jgi:quercetin dioxygenase-like cupin family protein
MTIPRVHSEYRRWVTEQGVPLESGNYQPDLNGLALHPWPRVGGAGVILNHDKSNESNDCWVVTIPPAQSLRPDKHLFEKMVYVLAGRGATRVWSAEGVEQAFEWEAGSLFSLPLNVRHQHYNGDGTVPARLLMVTNAPVVMNMFQSAEFVFGCDHAFVERFSGESGYFDGSGTLDGRMWQTNFIADVRAFELLDYPERGGGGRNIQLTLAGNSMRAHISEFPAGRYKKAHRHGPGAHVLILEGRGYSLMWPDGQRPMRYDWRAGSLVVPPDNWFHQHFNTGDSPARYLALRYMDTRTFTAEGVPLSNISTRLGGDQIEYEDEAPEIRTTYEAALRQEPEEEQLVS